MRPPRPGSRWSARRLCRRACYAAYIASEDWYTRRRLWYAEHVRITGSQPSCSVCGQPWRLADGDLHHASYDRLGHERHHDLIAMCRAHHQALHDLWDAAPSWRRLGRPHATAGIIAALRRTLHQEHPVADHERAP
jgi:hypothetical protein